MDFAFLPPEINSARMYTGPGSGPFLAAAGSWDSLAAELGITAESCESVLSGLTGLYWRGPTAELMSARAAPYLGWLHTTAERAKQTAMQAQAAAAAYELAYAMTVPPAAVAANRAQLAALIATNFFGQNTAAIAATEAQYAEYWAQDAAAMYGYATNVAAATQLTPFSSPPQTTNPDGLSAQNAAVNQATVSAAASNPVSQALIGTLTAAPLLPTPSSLLSGILPVDYTLLDVALFQFSTLGGVRKTAEGITKMMGAANKLGVLPFLGPDPEKVAPALPTLSGAPQLTGAASSLGGGAGLGNVTANLARAGRVGSMSVPASWATPSSSPVTALSSGALPTLPETGELARSGSAVPGIPGIPGGTISRATGAVPRYGARLTVMPRPPAAG
jgi:PPE-repeat protein